MSNVYLFTPLYDGRLRFSAANSMLLAGSRRHNVKAFHVEGSLLSRQCTMGWADALNLRDREPGCDWFAQLHDDITPPDFWIDSLIEIAEQHQADFVSAVVPFKNESGLTSTALWWPGGPVDCFNLTQAQVRHPQFPDTFGARQAANALASLPEPFCVAGVPGDILLANTGCMVCRLDRPWCDDVWFDNRTEMHKVDGKRVVTGLSEDWYFTKAIADQGGKVMATRLLTVLHHGRASFDSSRVWGQPRPNVGR